MISSNTTSHKAVVFSRHLLRLYPSSCLYTRIFIFFLFDVGGRGRSCNCGIFILEYKSGEGLRIKFWASLLRVWLASGNLSVLQFESQLQSILLCHPLLSLPSIFLYQDPLCLSLSAACETLRFFSLCYVEQLCILSFLIYDYSLIKRYSIPWEILPTVFLSFCIYTIS